MNLSTSVTETTDTREAGRPGTPLELNWELVRGRLDAGLPLPREISLCWGNVQTSICLAFGTFAQAMPWLHEFHCYEMATSGPALRWFDGRSADGRNITVWVHAEPSAEEPERTLAAVEDDAEARHADSVEVYDASVEDAHLCGKCGGGVFWWTAVGTPSRWRHTDQADSYRVGAHRPEVEHGYTHREGLGFLANDPDCQDCCDAARDAYAASVAEKVGGPFPGQEPRTERIEIGADGCGCPMMAEFKVAADGTINPAWIDGSERTEHGEFCWDAAAGQPTDADRVSGALEAKAAEAGAE